MYQCSLTYAGCHLGTQTSKCKLWSQTRELYHIKSKSTNQRKTSNGRSLRCHPLWSFTTKERAPPLTHQVIINCSIQNLEGQHHQRLTSTSTILDLQDYKGTKAIFKLSIINPSTLTKMFIKYNPSLGFIL